MSRLVYSVMFAFSLSVLSISAVGCGGGAENTVVEETRTQADIDQEEAEYDKMMDETEADDVTE
jgi:hypothetical protein